MSTTWWLCAVMWFYLLSCYWAGYVWNAARIQYKWWLNIALAWLFIAMFRTIFVDWMNIPSGSMEPTIKTDEYILANRFAYGPRIPLTGYRLWSNSPHYGEIIIFTLPQKNKDDFIKRVVGLPGDVVIANKEGLRVNGQWVYQRGTDDVITVNHNGITHGVRFEKTARDVELRVTVPENEYFVIGDNYDKSDDSRVFGTIPIEAVIARKFGQ